jgi:hypothetical protein
MESLTLGAQAIVSSEPSWAKAQALVMAWRFTAGMRDHSQWLKAVRTTPTVVDTLEPVVLVRAIVLCGIDRVCPKG